MAIDVVERLKNDPEFIKKVAEAVLNNVLASKLTNIENTVNQIVEKFAENDRKFNMLLEEIRNLREEQTKLREEFNKLLEEQRKLSEEQKSLRDEQNKLREDFNKLLEEQKSLRDEQNKLREDFSKLLIEVKSLREEQKRLSDEQAKLREEQVKLREDFNKLLIEVKSLREEQKRLSDEQAKLREDFNRLLEEQRKLSDEQIKLREEFNKLLEEQKSLREEQTRLREEMVRENERHNKEMEKLRKQAMKAIENISISLEEEAHEYLKHKLKKEYNIHANVINLNIHKVVEFDIFAELQDIVIVGEVKLRAGTKAISQLERAVDKLIRVRPELSKKKIIKMIYAKRLTDELIEECKVKGIYLTTGVADITPLNIG